MSTTGLRKAAVALACLHPDDRSWVLENLRPSWRYDLRRLLLQIESMKLPDFDIAREAVRICRDEQPLHPPAPDRLLAGMRGLSATWCARVLAACAPDHMEVFAANSGSAKANAVRTELFALPHLPPKVAEALTRIVRDRADRGVSRSAESN